jgi:formylglycine-generating enzyme required for sulfatase activity
VENVSWSDIQVFLANLNAQTGQSYRLPTEAEWEYAAKGGPYSQGYRYAGSNHVDEVGWHSYNLGAVQRTHPVGQKLPNELGLYDMSGNVWEWVQDWWGYYSAGAETDPMGPVTGAFRVIRGGSWYDTPWYQRPTYRYSAGPVYLLHFGLRLVLPQAPGSTIKISTYNQSSTDYSLLVSVEGTNISTVQVLGPGITGASGPMGAMLYTLDARPALGTTYTVRITYTDGVVEERTFTIDAINDNFAYLTSPADGSTVPTTTPTFVWTEGPGAVSHRLVVKTAGGAVLWQADYPAGVVSAAFDEDGTASGPLAQGSEYRVDLHAFDAAGNRATTTTTVRVGAADGLPPPPTGLTATAGVNTILLTWDAAPGATSYRVYWGTEDAVTTGSEYGGETTDTAFLHTGVLPGWTYYYRVASVAAAGEGDLSTAASGSPSGVGGVSIRAVAAGWAHSAGLMQDGSVWTWGAAAFLGDPTRTQPLVPGAVPGLDQVASIAVSDYGGATLALRTDGTVWGWGGNIFGTPSGDFFQATPQQVMGLANVRSISTNWLHSLAVDESGLVWSWGSNLEGRLGDDTVGQRYVPSPVPGLSNAVAVAAGGTHSLALSADGTVWAWGSNGYGQLGIGSSVVRTSVPTQVPGLAEVVSIVAGYVHSLALKSDGTVMAWGNNDFGGIGDGSRIDRFTPVPVVGLGEIARISAGVAHNLAVTQDGSVYSWGFGYHGQLGVGDVGERLTPATVVGLPPVVSISAGYAHSMAITNDGRVWAWGGNEDGRLGDGSTVASYLPTQVVGLPQSFTYTDPLTGMEFVWVPPGTFQMGDTFGGGHYSHERPVHAVTLTQGYYLGKTEVTQAQWQAVMGSNPSYFASCGPDCPVEGVSWNDIQVFLANLNAQTGQSYRLPTEAEWEYAARGGPYSQGYKYAGSNTVGEVAWTRENNTPSGTKPVGTKLPNELGLYDLSGNVFEWVQDWWSSYTVGAQIDPTGPTTDSLRVLRGGSWSYDAFNARVSYRGNNGPSVRYNFLGFRLALSP